ncbi:MAG: hypothetical protein F2735_03995 [Actinobacteria bacterium]|nr:hypothetical protein [Actinomycetota bacterium]
MLDQDEQNGGIDAMSFTGGSHGDRMLAQMQADDLKDLPTRGPKWDRKVWILLVLSLLPFVALVIAAAITQ